MDHADVGDLPPASRHGPLVTMADDAKKEPPRRWRWREEDRTDDDRDGNDDNVGDDVDDVNDKTTTAVTVATKIMNTTYITRSWLRDWAVRAQDARKHHSTCLRS
jgi:hypothetical protein